MSNRGFWVFYVVLMVTSCSQPIDTQSSVVTFKASKGESSIVSGTLKGMEGRIRFDPDHPERASFQVCLDPLSIETDRPARDNHLRSELFLDAESYPGICFISHEASPTEKGFITSGELTIKGITHRVEIPFTFMDNTFHSVINLQRLDYQVGFTTTDLIGNEVELEISCILL